jgi:exosortase
MTQLSAPARRVGRLGLFVALAAPLASVLWAYWSTLVETADCWAHDPQYSHGYLVPLFAAALLWFRRDLCPSSPLKPTLWGALLLVLGIGLRLYATRYYYVWPSSISLLPTLAGLCLLVGGWPAWRWAWPSIAFLAFMLPLPHTVSIRLAGPLQELATTVCTFLLQTLGIPALAEGNNILLSETDISIVEACSGLRMLVIFFALSTAVALLLRRPFWERMVVVFSAVPIALVSNILRITVTGVLHEKVDSATANAVFHDLAGWLMMPLGLGMLWVELHVLSRLWLAPPPAPPRSSRVVPPPPAQRRPARNLALRPHRAA